MADISALGQLQSSEPLDAETYAPVSSGFQLPRAGRYTVRAPESIPDSAFGASKAGFLTAQVDPTIVGPSNEGFQLRYIKVSAKTYDRGNDGKKASQMGDYLLACGQTTIPGEPQQLADAVQATAGRTYEVVIDWRAHNQATGLTVKGMKNFPKDKDGNPQPFVEDKQDIDPTTGEPRRIWARLEVQKFIPAA